MKITDGFTYLTEVKNLIQAYTDSLGRDLSFQNLNAELADLQKKYGFPAAGFWQRLRMMVTLWAA